MDLKNFFKQRSWTLLIFMAAVVFISCDAQRDYDRSTGRTNEILVVTNTKAMWEGNIGAPIKRFFESPLPGLPQEEPRFQLFNIAEKDLNKTFRAQHNILIVDINANFAEPIVETRKNHWSKPQRLIKVTAPDSATFFRVFDEHKEAFLKAFNELEIERTNEQFKMARSLSLRNTLEKKFGFGMLVPSGFVIAAQSDGFLWLRQAMHKVKQDVELGIIIYEMPYSDTAVFSEFNILNRRDSLTKRFVPGPSDGSYMTTSTNFIEPVFSRIDDFVTGFAVETRGLWMVEGDFMGGPFISYTFVDPKNERVITVDGYVYNPADLKRNFVRQMESIFHTISFGENTE